MARKSSHDSYFFSFLFIYLLIYYLHEIYNQVSNSLLHVRAGELHNDSVIFIIRTANHPNQGRSQKSLWAGASGKKKIIDRGQ
jgi:hypothetical protein